MVAGPGTDAGVARTRAGDATRRAHPVVPPRGFEPLISTLKGWRPRPLDDGGEAGSVARRPIRSGRGAGQAPGIGKPGWGRQPRYARASTTATAKHPAAIIPAMPPPTASRIDRPASPSWPERIVP